MLTFTIRRLILAIPTLLFISLVIFALLELAPGDPMAQVPLTVPDEVKQKMREALGLGEPAPIRFWKWMVQFFWIEPQVMIDNIFGTKLAWHWEPVPADASAQLIQKYQDANLLNADGTQVLVKDQRIISWQSRSPVMEIVAQRIPQTLWVVGTAYVVAVLIAIPVGVYSAYRQYSFFDNAGTFVTMVGFSVPPFFSGVLVIVIFSVQLGWFPSIYDTTLKVVDWESFKKQLLQMVMPVMVLALQITSQISNCFLELSQSTTFSVVS